MNSESKKSIAFKSANIHVFGRCNYRCEHCFDRCLTHEYLAPEDWTEVLTYLRSKGVEKINLAGGEPMLYPFLDQMCRLVKGMGFKLSIVTNGSRVTEEWVERMAGTVDWIGLSVDSPDEDDELEIGRHAQGVQHIENVVRVAEMCHRHGIKVKLNITVVRRSWNKDFSGLIARVKPQRVKCFRAVTMEGANDDIPDTWSITDGQFAAFKRNHEGIPGIVFEDNCDMVGSYVMFDPMGRWMVDAGNRKRFYEFEVLRREGLHSLVDVDRYFGRNAVYEW